MKLEDAVEKIRGLIFKDFDKYLSRMGLLSNNTYSLDRVPADLLAERQRMDDILANLQGEVGEERAREKLIDELSFTLFNRIAGVKVLEAEELMPEVFTRHEAHGGHSFGHKLWLEQQPQHAALPLNGLREYIRHAFSDLSEQIQLYSPEYLFDLLPEVFDLNNIIEAFNGIEREDWLSDDIMGWMYEYYNRSKRAEFKAGKQKIEYDRVALTSQVYTPRWVVEFILNNSLGKLWMEQHPESSLKDRHDIALPQELTPRPPLLGREGEQDSSFGDGSEKTPLLGGAGGGSPRPLEEIKILDPAMGSGNFLLYAFDLLTEMYEEEGYAKADIPRLILEHNLYGIDLDDRAVQIAQLGLYIKALKYLRARPDGIKECHRVTEDTEKTPLSPSRMNLVSTDFYLPPYEEVQDFFKELTQHTHARVLMQELWDDLRMAHKFGSLIRIEERIQAKVEWFETQRQIDWETIDADWQTEALGKIKEAIERYSDNAQNSTRFFRSKTLDSITFVEILLNKFDVVVANPPYTSSANYGKELRIFVETNYKKPLAFHNNLFAAFLKRNSELINKKGKIGIIHPLTFMYIKTFEDMRKYILDNFHIHVFVEYGLSDLFGGIMADPAFYILERDTLKADSLFISMNQYTRTPEENFKEEYTKTALKNYILKKPNKNIHLVAQSKLKLIDSYPYIYWISDEFRNKFTAEPLKESTAIKTGLSTGDNLRFIRFWWEIHEKKIPLKQNDVQWIPLMKGGPYNKWYGNIWLTVNWEKNGDKIKNFPGAMVRSEEFYFTEGITYSKTSTKGSSFRKLPPDCIFEAKGCSIFLTGEANIDYLLALVNSRLTNYIVNCLNSTVETNVGDLQRVPFVHPSKEYEDNVSLLASQNVEIKKHLCEFSIIEMNYTHNPLLWAKAQTGTADLAGLLKHYLDYENRLLAQVLLHEAIIDELIFEVYQLSESDRSMVLDKEGIPVGSLPMIRHRATENTEKNTEEDNTSVTSVSLWQSPQFVQDYIGQLPVFSHRDTEDTEKSQEENSSAVSAPLRQLDRHGATECTEKNTENSSVSSVPLWLTQNIEDLYRKNVSLEDICRTVGLNPLSVAQVLEQSRVLPEKRSFEIVRDLLIDTLREVLQADDDGIMPLVDYAGETSVQRALYDALIAKGFSDAQIGQFKRFLGRDINSYLEQHLFKDLADRLNLFMYLPKTPFIWHLSSGPQRGFEAFALIYAWSRDKLLRLRSVYVEKRESSLKNRRLDLTGDESLSAKEEVERISRQLEEIVQFKAKIDELLQSGYDPTLDDGVGKNIAPLQEKGLLKHEVLKKTEVKKYLEADW